MKNVFLIIALSVFFLIPTVGYAGEKPMPLPKGSKAEAVIHNKEGIEHWILGEYDVALTHFSMASKVDGASGEVHFNEAISYDKLGKHGVATKHFGVLSRKLKVIRCF